jgi:cellobiose phosphorylase
VDYHFGTTHYFVNVENPDGVNRGIRQIVLNGVSLPDNRIPLTDDGRQHEVGVLMGSALPPRDRKSAKNDRDDLLSRGVK